MNFDDPFEKKLASLRGHELPPEWRAEILAQASAAPRAPAKPKRTPRWLVAGWSLAWAAIITLHFTTPAESRETQNAQTSASALAPERIFIEERSQTLYALLRSNP